MKDVLIGGITVTLVGEDLHKPGTEVKLAVLAHGRTRSKQDTLKFASLLLKSVPNLICAVWDLPNHGTRLVNEAANGSWNSGNILHIVEMQAVIDQGAAEAALIFAYAPLHLPELIIAGNVMIGTSLGGYITWKVAADHTELLSAAVPIISSPDVLKIMDSRWEAYRASHRVDANVAQLAFPDSLRASMAANTAKVDGLRASPLPILAICGSDDPLVPPESTIRWSADRTPNHRVEIVPGVKHEVPREMIDLTAEYLIGLVTIVE